MKFVILALLALMNAHGRDRRVRLQCPTSLSSSGDAAIRNLQESLSLMDPALRPEWCGRDSEVYFLAVGDIWGDLPTDRFTAAFAVCLHDGGEATWSRISYLRKWPTVLEPSEVPGPRRRIPKRFATPYQVRAAGGAFPSSAIDDLRGWLNVVGFWDLPTEFPADNPKSRHLGVRVMRVRSDDREKMVVGEDLCSPLPSKVNLLFEAMLSKPDPAAYLASKRDLIRQRLDELRESPTRP